jgi:hypothetical protein
MSRSTNETRQLLPGEAVASCGSDPVVSDVRLAQAADGFDAWSASRDRALRRLALFGVCLAANGRRRGSRSVRGVANRRPSTVPSGFRMSSAPVWAPYSDGYWIQHGRVGPDVGRQRAVGLRAVPLRPLGVDRRPLGLVPRWLCRASRLGACIGPRGTAVPRGESLYPAAGPLYGWVPLGWREPYYPGWRRCSANCWARFNRPYGVNAGRTRRPARPRGHLNLAVPGALSRFRRRALCGTHIGEVEPRERAR